MRRVVLFASLAVAAAACVPDQATLKVAPTAPPQPTIEATSTLRASASPAPELTATRTPKPTNTPLPDIAFSETAADNDYLVPLMVQRLTPFEAIVHFELDRPDSGWLLYQPIRADFQGWWSIPLAEDQVSHQIPLVGLTPGTSYRVQVGLGQVLESLRVPFLFGESWGPVRFEVPALGEPDLRFAVIGDSGFGDDQTRELIELMEGYDLDFVLHTGDAVYRANEESGPAEAFARKYFKMFAPLMLEVPIFPVLGNHDFDQPARSNGRPFFVRAFPALTDPSVPESALGTWYAFERSGIQFIMLDSQAFHGTGGRAEQTAWLEERLEDPSFRFSIPVFHSPPYTSGLHRNDGKALRLKWGPLFEAAQVPLVLSGHDHNYERIERNGVTYVVSGGGSPVLYRQTDRVEGSRKFYRRMHFVLAEIYQDRIELMAIDNGGTVLDRTTIQTNIDGN
ncbi:MAG: hypothetical protein BMS9Abin28_1939 [Anaerolineae bacterium]|nr:MAG: hypothetical protein BMS9Abin28_1939 [Anaerolineae bacterium]